MVHSTLRMYSIWILKANLVVWAINALLLVILVLLTSSLANIVSLHYFSLVILLETGAAFLVGGALAFSGSVSTSKAKEYVRKSDDRWSIDKLRESEKRANRYIILAIILFIESMLLSFSGI